MALLLSPSYLYKDVINVNDEEDMVLDISSDSDSHTQSGDELIEIVDSSMSEEDIDGSDEQDGGVQIGEDADRFIMTSEPSNPSNPTTRYSSLDFFQYENTTLKKGKTVELKDGDFLKIERILQAETAEIFLQGRRFRRTTKLRGIVARRPNEVCWVEETFLDGSYIEEDIPLDQIFRVRRLRLTNQAYESLNVSHTMHWPPDSKLYKSEGVLFCRLKYEVVYKSRAQQARPNSFGFVEKSIRGLYSDEVDGEFWEDPADQRAARKGLSTSIDRLRRSVSTVTLVDDGLGVNHAPRQYTFGDCFCGGGGMSCGAKMAGLGVKWGLDIDREALRTYQLNFDGASCENTSVDHFLNPHIFPPEQYHVDVLHMSPPCQSFSPAQVTKPEDFEDKQVVILAVNDLVKMVKPRVITMEETYGLLHPVNREFFVSVVNSLVDQNYSVRWKVMDFGEYGVPQKRRRVILIASRLGETLPNFPRPTHLNNQNTIAEAIADIPPGTGNHHPKDFLYPHRPYNAYGPLQSLIACGGGKDNYHPDGKRGFTEREFACLQTFPLDYKFTGTRTNIVKQIGNAVPPLPGMAIYEEILRELRRTDAMDV